MVYEMKINLEDGGSQVPTVLGGYGQGKKERMVCIVLVPLETSVRTRT